MEQANNYIEDIKADLSILPEEHLATIRDMIRLIAKSYKEEEKQEEDEKVLSKEILQVYADEFRKGFKLLMKKDLGLDISFQITEKYTLLKLTQVNLEEQKAEIEEIEEDFDLYALLEEQNLALIEYHSTARKYIKYKIRSLDEEDNFRDDDSEKASIFTEEGIYLLDISEPEKWTEEQAIIDRRNLLGLMFKALPTY